MKPLDGAKQIIHTLVKNGYTAYFAGGWVRDFLRGHPSADIDIATNASTEVIQTLFPKTIPVGVQFGVVIVLINGHAFEVSTFRQDFDYQDGRRPKRVEPSTPEEDASRRDFTINGMFYDPIEEKVIDFVGGEKDLHANLLRTIGNPEERFREDRLRMLRAVRFTHRFQLTMEEQTQKAIKKNASTLFPAVAVERVWQELKKMAVFPSFDAALSTMHELGLLKEIFPELSNLSTKALHARVALFQRFPDTCPAVLYLLELFPFATIDKQLAICERFKLSNEEKKLAQYVHSCRMLSETSPPADWAPLYVSPNLEVALDVIAARIENIEERETFFIHHHHAQKSLQKHLERIKNRTPLISSKDLKEEGILPGKTMGLLLKEAETFTINHNIEEKSEVMNRLKMSPYWPKESNG